MEWQTKMWKIIKNKKAFTLSEALITLSIIGVICSLTIPTLYRNHQEQVTVAKVKKFYATLDMAYNAAVLKNGNAKYWDTNNWTTANANKLYELLFKPYFKIEKACGTTNTGNCITNDRYKLINELVCFHLKTNYFGEFNQCIQCSAKK